jgi:hypothetical protein
MWGPLKWTLPKFRMFRISLNINSISYSFRSIANQHGVRYSDSTSYFKKYSSSKCKQVVCIHYGLDFHFKIGFSSRYKKIFPWLWHHAYPKMDVHTKDGGMQTDFIYFKSVSVIFCIPRTINKSVKKGLKCLKFLFQVGES